jgi:hypothetical protein
MTYLVHLNDHDNDHNDCHDDHTPTPPKLQPTSLVLPSHTKYSTRRTVMATTTAIAAEARDATSRVAGMFITLMFILS